MMEFKSIRPSGIEGVYEVTAGSTVLYYSPKNGDLLIGEIFNKQGENLTAKSRDRLLSEFIKELPLDKAIKIGNGKNTVIMFTDPDCPFCRRIEDYFKNRKDLTRYVFLLPLEQLHPKAAAKAQSIMCQKNKSKAFLEAMSGSLDNGEVKPCDDEKVKTSLDETRLLAQKMGIQGTPYLFVNGVPVRGADTNRIDKLLNDDSKK